MTVCSSFVVAFFLVKNVPLIMQRAWKNKAEDKEKKPPGFIKRFATIIYKSIIVFL
jgi:hypothetical protein